MCVCVCVCVYVPGIYAFVIGKFSKKGSTNREESHTSTNTNKRKVPTTLQISGQDTKMDKKTKSKPKTSKSEIEI